MVKSLGGGIASPAPQGVRRWGSLGGTLRDSFVAFKSAGAMSAVGRRPPPTRPSTRRIALKRHVIAGNRDVRGAARQIRDCETSTKQARCFERARDRVRLDQYETPAHVAEDEKVGAAVAVDVAG